MAASMAAKNKKKTNAEWPPASKGSDALESLRDGNPPNALLAFGRNAMGVGNHAWAIEYLRRGVDYLRYVVTSFPEVVNTVQGRLDAVTDMLVDAAAAIGDEATLEFSLSPNATAEHVAARAHKLLEAKHPQMAQQWFYRARSMPMTQEQHDAHLLRFGVGELTAQKRAKQIDVAFAAQLVLVAKAARDKLPPRASTPASRWAKREIDQVLRAAEKVVAAANEPAPDQTPAKGAATPQRRKTQSSSRE